MQLRYYQNECREAIYKWFQEQESDPLLVLATGTGKSVCIADFIRSALLQWPDQRMVCAIDTKELVKQNYEKFMQLHPNNYTGIYSAGLNRREALKKILFCGIQSVYKRAQEIGYTDILIVDECHMIGRNHSSMWQQFINALRKINPNLKVIGFTATPYRLDSGLLHTGKGAMFGGIAYEYGIKEGIRDKFLCEIVPKNMATKLDVTGVHKRGGDFIEKELQEAVNKLPVTRAAVDEIIQYGHNRKGWLIFSSGVAHAYSIRDIIRERGYSCEAIDGKTPAKERDGIIEAYKAQEIRCLVNNAVLTKGFDAPHIDLLAAMRPTQSPVLWLQMLGRGLRINEGKDNCLLLDFAQNLDRFGFIDEIEFKDKTYRDGEGDEIPPMKTCEECATVVHAAMRECPTCGYVFPFKDADDKIKSKATTEAVLSTQVKPEIKKVTKITYTAHKKTGKPDSLCVTYYSGITKRFKEWVCLEHKGYARQKALTWWKEAGGQFPVPATVEEAITRKNELKQLSQIVVRRDGKYWRVIERIADREIEGWI